MIFKNQKYEEQNHDIPKSSSSFEMVGQEIPEIAASIWTIWLLRQIAGGKTSQALRMCLVKFCTFKRIFF